MNKEKADKYQKLVKESQASYRDNPDDHKLNDIELVAPDINIAVENGEVKILDKGVSICKEINLYTYWQGLNYAEKTPDITYLLVAQDWGNLAMGRNEFMKRIIAINNGTDLLYYDKATNISETDDNLVELFKVLEYNIDEHRYDELFFTNFCLGYRTGRESGNMDNELMMKDAKNFRRLCEILEPKNILCLGKLTFECVYESLKVDGDCKPKGFSGSYNKFIETYGVNPITVHISNSHTTRIFPLAHPGAMGMLNRAPGIKSDFPPDATKEEKNKKQSETKDRRLKVQKSDWQRVKDAVQK